MANSHNGILIVDDNPDNIIILQAMIKEAFPENVVMTALNGPEGIRLAVANDPEVILLDVIMPDMDGFTVCRQLKADPQTADIPIIFVTALKGDREYRIMALDCGAEAFLSKPVDESELIAQVRAMIKIKAATTDKRDEKERLSRLVKEQTIDLQQANEQMLRLVESLKIESNIRKDSEERYRSIYEQAPLGISITDTLNGRIYQANEQYVKIIGRPITDEHGPIDWMSITHPDDLEEDHANMALIHAGKITSYSMQKRYIKPDGSIVWVNMKITPSNIRINGNACQLSMLEDITNRKKAEIELIASEAKFRTYTERAPIGIVVINQTGRMVEVNQTACQMAGFSEAELLQMSIQDFIDAKNAAEILCAFNNPRAKLNVEQEFSMRNKDNQEIWIDLIATKIANDRLIAFCSDISDRKKNEEKLFYYSYHDLMTGIYNRRYFEEAMISLDTESNLPITIVMGDLNGLKLVNESFGHNIGDELLKFAADAIRSECRPEDVVARTGGDEFSIILPRMDALAADQFISRIKERAQQVGGLPIALSISFGYETKTDFATSLQDTQIAAENFLFKHKLYESTSMRSRTIDLVMSTLFAKSGREMMHSKRVSEICEMLTAKLGLSNQTGNKIKIAGLIHDIGKIGIDETILNKPGRLDADEWKEMVKHPEIGWRILSSISEFSELANNILEHHERWDGKGYPKGLKGEEISLEARIICLADSFDAMTSERSYNKGLSVDQAVAEISRCAGTQFDPKLSAAFIELIEANKQEFEA